ncbi:N-6 DNA methylase [Myxococcus fulvus]|nr:N-6 DNA methylase [Myxococcus fulvus]
MQFLFHRKDSKGRPALGEPELERLAESKTLTHKYVSFGDILRNHTDAYKLFKWLDGHFNGDLFPGKRHRKYGATSPSREQEWEEEMRTVRPAHLALLADLVDGRLKLKEQNAQLHLWPLYAFDAIPLDFISSIYEELVGEGTGVHYTPHHLVDFVLDEVLPWSGDTWDLKVLDPACGSGIFLVKVFQRLVYRWRAANPGHAPRADILRGLLERNLFGVDIDDAAVRVASLSLYLAMCDEIDPRAYWTQVRLPPLYGHRLIHSDFFEEAKGFDSSLDADSFDLVVGNAPWGEETATEIAKKWAEPDWQLANRSLGPLFLVKAAKLTRPTGFVAMLQPAVLLYNRSGVAATFRRKLFETYEVEEVVDFSTLRRDAFENSIAQVCVVVLQPTPPDDTTIVFARARGRADGGGRDTIVIEATDVHELEKHEAAQDSWVWSVLWHGTRRDLELVRRLSKLPRTVGHLGKSRMGIVRGKEPKRRREPTILGRLILEQPAFPASTFLVLDTHNLEKNTNPYVTANDSRSLAAFEAPQLLIKMTWSAESGRFRAVVVNSHGEREGILCSQSYVSLHVSDANRAFLEAACLTLNSLLAVYFLSITGSSFTGFIPKALKHELLSLPIPGPFTGDIHELKSFADVDREVFALFNLPEADHILIEDFIERRDPDALKRQPDLHAYSNQLIRALEQAGLPATAVILELDKKEDSQLPLCVVVLYLRRLPGQSVRVERVTDDEFRSRLAALDQQLLRTTPGGSGGVLFRRVARIYDVVLLNRVRVPAVYFVKPNRRDCWTRSAALEDSDSLVADALVSAPVAIEKELGQ